MTVGYGFTDLNNIYWRSIEWNADNMPTQITHSVNGTTNLYYDGNSVRAKKVAGSTTYYIGQDYEIKNGNPIIYIFAGNLRVAKVEAGNARIFHKDHLGSSTAITNSSGVTVEATEYLPFGSMREHSGTKVTDYKFTDQELDSETGLYNYNARLYDPLIGRFISPDSMVPDPYNPQSLNRYSYCLNNPLIYVDPTGHMYGEYDDEDGVIDEEVSMEEDDGKSGGIIDYVKGKLEEYKARQKSYELNQRGKRIEKVIAKMPGKLSEKMRAILAAMRSYEAGKGPYSKPSTYEIIQKGLQKTAPELFLDLGPEHRQMIENQLTFYLGAYLCSGAGTIAELTAFIMSEASLSVCVSLSPSALQATSSIGNWIDGAFGPNPNSTVEGMLGAVAAQSAKAAKEALEDMKK